MGQIAAEQERQEWARMAQAHDPARVLEENTWWAFLCGEQKDHGFEKQGWEWISAPEPCFQDQGGFAYADPYRAALADQFSAWNVQFSRLPSFSIQSPLTGLDAGEMYAAFHVGTLFLHVHRCSSAEQGRSMSWHEWDRQRFLALSLQEDQSAAQQTLFTPADFEHEGGKPAGRLVLTSHGMGTLERCLNLCGDALETTAPTFRVRLPGDLRARHIAERFYQKGLVLESLGLEVEHVHTP